MQDAIWFRLIHLPAVKYSFFPYYYFPIDEDPGKYASGENIGTLNPYIRFHSTEIRHMFEAGKTVTRTYIIKPPAQGPIQAHYAVYAHWHEADIKPVTNPATDFPLDANSSMPYELNIYQDGLIDPDAPPPVQAEHIHFYVKSWEVIPLEKWTLGERDLLQGSFSGMSLTPHPDGLPDEYVNTYITGDGYNPLDPYPGTWTIIFHIVMPDLEFPGGISRAGTEWWIMDVEFSESDGKW
ncbi:MAG TPA: hypothetical protein VGB30_06310 [bacterium]|jgi:hypothetical protein